MAVAKHADDVPQRDEVARGLAYAHNRANTNTGKLLEVTSFAYAAIEVLAEKGFISIEELDERKKVVAERLTEAFREEGMGVIRAEPDLDKYTFEGGPGAEIDCASRYELCHAACCRMQFALTRQDVEEGVVKWNFGKPYMIRQEQDGYCTHLDRGTCACTVYAERPVPCRGYDCRKDTRIWADFEARVPSPELAKLFPEEDPVS
jgi:Fe-S-cluster containining protein